MVVWLLRNDLVEELLEVGIEESLVGVVIGLYIESDTFLSHFLALAMIKVFLEFLHELLGMITLGHVDMCDVFVLLPEVTKLEDELV
jgi:hypothetical protein